MRSALREDEIGSPTWAREDHVVFDPSCFAVLVDQVPAALSGSKTPPRVVTSGYKLRVRSGSSAHREPVDDGSGRKPALGRVLLGRRAQLQRAVRPPGAVLDRMPGKHTTQISFVGRSASGRSVSVRTVNTRRSAKQFARGQRGGWAVIPAMCATTCSLG